MKLKLLLVMVMLFAVACSPDAETTDGLVDATQDQTNSGTATTLAEGGTDPETGSSVTLSNGEGGGDSDTSETTESTALLQSGSSTSLGPTTTLQVFETDPNEEYAVPVNDIPAGQNPVYYTKFVVEKDGREIVWDRWWWGLLDGRGDVMVVDDGTVLADGPISGDDAVQTQDGSGTISIFGPNGDAVATVTQEDLTEAIRSAQAEAGIG